MKNKKLFELHADVCKAMAHPLRMEVIHLLDEREYCFADLQEVTGELKSNLSQHLKVMTKKGILKVRRDGQCSHFSLSSHKVAQACELMREVLIENIQEQQDILKIF
ncbi:winged helix-turn-helix transcriptional regulator [Antarcticibacterium arcticum]|uniref:Winged helix-turn-helix transcriptional regulator n=1 Tax=Antarcticibacterium arcticum TaxID=2585771 RepID=A0A5B8YFS7_9FLAO|nr:metalloregulator ArsR/SmtB family transcription factor [Antarcticibacterium arcticum]QED36604.1 winged helix-turn-helix transcriptional regulator [Antarcticibacterium arcticum]